MTLPVAGPVVVDFGDGVEGGWGGGVGEHAYVKATAAVVVVATGVEGAVGLQLLNVGIEGDVLDLEQGGIVEHGAVDAAAVGTFHMHIFHW